MKKTTVIEERNYVVPEIETVDIDIHEIVMDSCPDHTPGGTDTGEGGDE